MAKVEENKSEKSTSATETTEALPWYKKIFKK